MRAFVGLPLPDDVADDLARRAAGAGAGRVIPAESLHLTLAFLDDQPQHLLAALGAELDLIHAPAPVLRWGAPDFLGSPRNPVFALMVEADPALVALQARVIRAARDTGIALPATRFRPHVSLLRLSARDGTRARERLQHFILSGALTGLAPVVAEVLTLYHSRLDERGARYESLADWPLEIAP
ncbi:MAG: RNA 2',3'-cyclic phosphodiesterase [Rubellimicrobium sp.]|nr:RNA 2',3'-cyclic phosphodiesterase [Rubellimicrobium sp.]